VVFFFFYNLLSGFSNSHVSLAFQESVLIDPSLCKEVTVCRYSAVVQTCCVSVLYLALAAFCVFACNLFNF